MCLIFCLMNTVLAQPSRNRMLHSLLLIQSARPSNGTPLKMDRAELGEYWIKTLATKDWEGNESAGKFRLSVYVLPKCQLVA